MTCTITPLSLSTTLSLGDPVVLVSLVGPQGPSGEATGTLPVTSITSTASNYVRISNGYLEVRDEASPGLWHRGGFNGSFYVEGTGTA